MKQSTSVAVEIPHLLARNSFYNLATHLALILLGLWAIPAIVQGISRESFGLLSLVWVFVGYFSVLDLGLSRATTKFLAESLFANKPEETRAIVRTSLTASLGFSVILGGLFWAATPVLTTAILSVPADMVVEAKQAFYLVALALPFILTGAITKSVQMAAQRFDLVNIFQAAAGISQWVGSVVVVKLGHGLTEIVLVTVASRTVATVLALLFTPRIVPHVFRGTGFWDEAVFRKLVVFGGWVFLSQMLTPLLLYLDRVLIGTFLTLAAVAYYAVQQEVLARVLIVPQSLTTTLFPAFSEQSVQHGPRSRVAGIYFRSLKYLLLFMLPVIVVFVLYASDILQVWLGKDFAIHGALVLQILSVGLLFNALAQIPFVALQAYGRPDLTAKFHLIELPFTVALNLILIPLLGIVGAALAWSIRAIVDSFLLFVAAHGYVGESIRDLGSRFSQRRVMVYALPFAVCLVVPLLDHGWLKLAVMTLFAFLYMAVTWGYGFDDVDRRFFLQLRAKMFEGP